ncbi:MAG TPA: RNA-binding protein [Ottowia sp.]|mgnify:CR=1 FL=1|uniref:RNA-binding protein n=1 Tax=Ottowia sp. TaxID=1898956 RepID=UPI002B816429|nr:RNA-binding protein [Ottowia sp.]HMN22168.1 RNA-binding protein [Ottowia sp.]
MNSLSELNGCADVVTLRTRLQQVCEVQGRIRRLDILQSSHEGMRQAICFLRMETSEQEAALMQALGVGRFGGEIVFVVNLNDGPHPESQGPSSQWTDWGAL